MEQDSLSATEVISSNEGQAEAEMQEAFEREIDGLIQTIQHVPCGKLGSKRTQHQAGRATRPRHQAGKAKRHHHRFPMGGHGGSEEKSSSFTGACTVVETQQLSRSDWKKLTPYRSRHEDGPCPRLLPLRR